MAGERVCGPKGFLCDVQCITCVLGCCIMLVAKQQQQGGLVVQLAQLRAAAQETGNSSSSKISRGRSRSSARRARGMQQDAEASCAKA